MAPRAALWKADGARTGQMPRHVCSPSLRATPPAQATPALPSVGSISKCDYRDLNGRISAIAGRQPRPQPR
jgi:hypothetical protein